MSDADEIRDLLNTRIEALKRRDAAAANALLDPAIVAFEVVGPLQLPASQATDCSITQAWLDSFDECPSVMMKQLAIYADGTVAFCHSLNRLQGRRIDGQIVDMTMRSTLGFRKEQGSWRIVHGHTSLPR